MQTTIQALRRKDKFKFNNEVYTVGRKWIDDDRPLIAYHDTTNERHDFSHEGLEVEKLDIPPTSKHFIKH